MKYLELLFTLTLSACTLPNTMATGNSGDNAVNVNIFLDGKLLKDILNTSPTPTPSPSPFPSATPSPTLSPPMISAFHPLKGASGTVVTIEGSFFSAAQEVLFNGVPAQFNVLDDFHLSAVIPLGSTTGPIQVTTSFGSTTSSTVFLREAFVTTLTGSSQGFQDGEEAQFDEPNQVVFDTQGNLLIADRDNHRIRKIDTQGMVTTYAGSGQAGFQDGSALVARFNHPVGLAIASDGTLYVSEESNHRIRKITPSGTVTTLAGTGQAGFQDGSSARFRNPAGLALAPDGTLYVADQGNHRIRAIDPTGSVSTLAGSGTRGFEDGLAQQAKFDHPTGLALAPDGSLYMADRNNHRIRKYTTDGMVNTLAGTGQAGYADGLNQLAQFNQPSDLVLDSQGQLWIADRKNHRIRIITVQEDVQTLAGTGQAGFTDGSGSIARFREPTGLALHTNGQVSIADRKNHRIREMRP